MLELCGQRNLLKSRNYSSVDFTVVSARTVDSLKYNLHHNFGPFETSWSLYLTLKNRTSLNSKLFSFFLGVLLHILLSGTLPFLGTKDRLYQVSCFFFNKKKVIYVAFKKGIFCKKLGIWPVMLKKIKLGICRSIFFYYFKLI